MVLYIHSGGLKWNRFSADAGGGTIQFVMHMENKFWVEAVKELLNITATQYSYSSEVHEKPLIAFISIVPILLNLANLLMKPMLEMIYQAFNVV